MTHGTPNPTTDAAAGEWLTLLGRVQGIIPMGPEDIEAFRPVLEGQAASFGLKPSARGYVLATREAMFGRFILLTERLAGEVESRGLDPRALWTLARCLVASEVFDRPSGQFWRQASDAVWSAAEAVVRRLGAPIGVARAARSKASPPDKPDNSEKKLPRSPDVRDLIQLLQVGLPKGKTQIQIAREFTRESAGCAPKAENLLRQASRFRHLWSG